MYACGAVLLTVMIVSHSSTETAVIWSPAAAVIGTYGLATGVARKRLDRDPTYRADIVALREREDEAFRRRAPHSVRAWLVWSIKKLGPILVVWAGFLIFSSDFWAALVGVGVVSLLLIYGEVSKVTRWRPWRRDNET
jgi:hypothetical protein